MESYKSPFLQQYIYVRLFLVSKKLLSIWNRLFSRKKKHPRIHSHSWALKDSPSNQCKLVHSIALVVIVFTLKNILTEFSLRSLTLPVIVAQCGNYRNLLSTVWKLWKFTVTHLWQKFRENNVFTKEVTKELIWRNFSFFHTVARKHLFPSICLFVTVKGKSRF